MQANFTACDFQDWSTPGIMYRQSERKNIRGKITPTFLATYYQRNRETYDDAKLEALAAMGTQKVKNDQYNGFMSPETRRLVGGYCRNWFSSITAYNENKPKKKQRLPTFITLTYPIPPTHTDKELKRHHLDRVLVQMQRTGRLQNYFWKAETQANGNLHFHIIGDVYVKKGDVRNMWNHTIEEYGGYCSKYGKNPYGTRIEAVTDFERTAFYLQKYLSKPDETRRKVDGRVWGCSDSLRNLQNVVLKGSASVGELIASIEPHAKIEQIEINEYVNIFKYDKDIYTIREHLPQNVRQQMESTYHHNMIELFSSSTLNGLFAK